MRAFFSFDAYVIEYIERLDQRDNIACNNMAIKQLADALFIVPPVDPLGVSETDRRSQRAEPAQIILPSLEKIWARLLDKFRRGQRYCERAGKI